MDMQPILSNNALAILKKRYLAKDSTGNIIETPEEMFRRVAKHVANGDAALEDKFYNMMASGDFLPNTPCLANAGKPGGTGMLSACFCLPIEDSMESIFKTLRDAAMVMRSGGGIGASFSSIRPEGDIVKATGGVASGPISFMKIFDTAIENVKQGGMRRGAAMAVLRCDHPDVLKFIDAKRDLKLLTNFNVSVGITDAFMSALENGEDYDLVNPKTGKIVERVSARVVWKKIIQNAWFSGEPGVLFLDRINQLDPLSEVEEIVATNPCQPGWATVLTPDGVKTFDEISFGSVVWSGKQWTKVISKIATGKKHVYAYTTANGTFYGTPNHRIVQNGKKIEVKDAKFIDVCPRPGMEQVCAPQAITKVEYVRQEDVYDITVEADEHTYWTAGLLVANCGEAPLPPYGSCNLGSINLEHHVIGTAGKAMLDYDKLAKTVELGVQFLDGVISVNKFPLPELHEQDQKSRRIGLGPMGFADALIRMGIQYDSDEACSLAYSLMKFINDTAIKASEELAKEKGAFPLWEQSKWAKQGNAPRRNAVVTTSAPTGTISMIAGCSSGIEPLFAVAMMRNQADMKMPDVNPLFVKIAKHEGWYSDELMEKVATKGTAKVDGVPKNWQEVFVTAGEISPEMHVKMQAAFQANIEQGTSKTVNAPKSATVEDVESAYALAYKLGCKGITVYRDGCRENQVLSVGTKAAPAPDTVIPVVETRTKDGKLIERRSTARRTHNDGRRRGETISKKTAFGTLHVTINLHPNDNEPFECFVELGKSGMETKAMTEALGRALSYLLSIPSAISPRDRLSAIADQFIAIGGGQTGFGKNKTYSVPDGIGKALRDFIGDPEAEVEAVEATPLPEPAKKNGKNGKNGNGHHHFDICPECLCPTMTKGGKCDVCINPDCGYSKC